jgi:hypothetical protein
MRCPKCLTENPEDKTLCHDCGANLFLTCPRYNSKSIPGRKFCGDCSQKLEALPVKVKPIPSFENELKHVAVLFSDMTGYSHNGEA